MEKQTLPEFRQLPELQNNQGIFISKPTVSTIRKLTGFELTWTAFLRVNSTKKAELVIRRLNKAIGYEVRLTDCEQYWKDKSLYVVHFTCALQAVNISDAIFETLQLSERIAPHWVVAPPTQYEEGFWEFHGGAQKPPFTGIEMIDFHLTNFTQERVEE